VGVTELASRYKTRPGLAVRTIAGVMYVALNIAAACGALLLMRQLGWTLGMQPSDPAVPATQVLVAGFGAMALLRSSVFVLRVGDKDVGIGPGVFLSGITEVVDAAVERQVSRGLVRIRGRLARMAMEGVDFERAVVALPTYCLALSAGAFPAEAQQQLAEEISVLRASEMIDQQKVALLGLLCINVFGETLVTAAVEHFGATMFAPAGSPAAMLPTDAKEIIDR
jgi:hypothetical protein